ncbi:hypothetical protein IFU39_16750 [Paenibacillus sp. CFBP 13594]|uniref:hypothetical protein n=1 Tax=Paenibacillus sp. CFBP 13594 TaxID=2774037 RepID=UPI00119CD374|nr:MULTISPECIES: hypothetical protein [Paenibacillus]MBD8839464.1 hypothetical protein [Paenibacillus sp. CFBP 13594]
MLGRKVFYYAGTQRIDSVISGVEDGHYKLSNGLYFHGITKEHSDYEVVLTDFEGKPSKLNFA